MNNLFKLILLCSIFCCSGNNNKNAFPSAGKSQISFDVYPVIQDEKQGLKLYLNLPNSIFVFKKKEGKFLAEVRVSASVFDEENKRVANHFWDIVPSEKFFDESRNPFKYAHSEYFFPLDEGQYSISLLVEDLDSGYQWRKEKSKVVLKQSAMSVIPFVKFDNIFNYTSPLLPEKTDTLFLQISMSQMDTIGEYLYYNLDISEKLVLTDSVKINPNEEMMYIPIHLKDSWVGVLKINTKINEETNQLKFQLPGHNVFYWKDIKTTIQIMSYILTYKEYKELSELDDDEQLEFIKQYWKQLDPTPKTTYNEVKEEFFRRIKRVNMDYSEFGNGWQSDRGRIYIIYGEPEQIELIQKNTEGNSYEIWYYPHGKQFIFIDEGLFGNYRLYREIN